MPRKYVAFFVHHGTTEFNEKGLYTGFVDVPLNDQGVRDAEKAAEFLSDQDIHRVVTSPLCRARRTAEIIASRHGGRYIEECHSLFPWLIPMFWGKSKEDFDEKLEDFIKDPSKRPKFGETLDEFMDRTHAFMEKNLNCECCTVFVAHTTNLIAVTDLIDGTEDHEECVAPGGIIGIYETDDGWGYDILLGEVTEPE